MVGMDPNSIIPAAVVSTVSLVNNAISSVKNAKELIKDSQDGKLHSAVSEALADVLELRIRLLELDGENLELKAKLAQKTTLKRGPEFGYYFKDGDPDPLCPKCYEGQGKVAYLTPLYREPDLDICSRYCRQCSTSYYE
jgi:hypothetical protein